MSPVKRGRPAARKPIAKKSVETPSEKVEETPMAVEATERPSRDIPVERAVERPQRTPLGARNRLTFSKQDPNYVYRWVNDQDDRLSQAQEASYEFVYGDSALAGNSRLESTPLDGRISKPAGQGIRTYLMRIPKDLYQADQLVKMQSIDASEAAMKPNPAKNQYGSGLTND